jgi:predicted ATPase
MAELMALMERADGRLITILGPGGMGKTRLMLQTAQQVTTDYKQGVWLVELAALTDATLIPERIAAVLGVQEQPGRQMQETLVDYLRHKTLLLLLDNAEHLVRAVSELTAYLLQHCPRLKILVTSREPLLISGEMTLPIASLSLPQVGQKPQEIAASEGVKLFLERAKAVRPDFEVTAGNAAVIGEMVRRLDGIPLALELAAARLRMMTVEQINGRLNDRFRLLTGGSRTALPRQQTLQALIDWSWNLLE